MGWPVAKLAVARWRGVFGVGAGLAALTLGACAARDHEPEAAAAPATTTGGRELQAHRHQPVGPAASATDAASGGARRSAPVGPAASASPGTRSGGAPQPAKGAAGKSADAPAPTAAARAKAGSRVSDRTQDDAFRKPLPQGLLDAKAPAMQLANLSPAQCRKRLSELSMPVKRWHGAAPGVATPLHLQGRLHGVRFAAAGAPSPYGLLDCRLALLMVDFAKVLSEFNVVEVRVDSMYRPRAHLPGKRKKSQHAHGLAIDIVSLKVADGRTLSVEGDWHTGPGSVSCGPTAEMTEPTDDSVLLRDIVCEVARRGIFHHMLTPSYNAAHQNHFHFDIKRDAKTGYMH